MSNSEHMPKLSVHACGSLKDPLWALGSRLCVPASYVQQFRHCGFRLTAPSSWFEWLQWAGVSIMYNLCLGAGVGWEGWGGVLNASPLCVSPAPL